MMTAIIGQRELGKSTLALFYTRRRDSAGKYYASRRIIFDPRGQIDPVDAETFVVTGLLDESTDAADFDALDRVLTDGGEIIIKPDKAIRRVFFIAMDAVMKLRKRRADVSIVVLVDESRLLKDDLSLEDSPFDWLVRMTQRSNTNIFLTCHSPKDVPPDLRRIMDRWCFFRAEDPIDYKTITERCGDEVAMQIGALKPHQFIKWESGKPTAYRDPSAWYTPLGSSSVRLARETDDLRGGESLRRGDLLDGYELD